MAEEVEVTEVEKDDLSSSAHDESQPPIVVVASDTEESTSENSQNRYVYYSKRKRAHSDRSVNPSHHDAGNIVQAIVELTSVQKGILGTLKEISDKLSELKNVTSEQMCRAGIETNQSKINEIDGQNTGSQRMETDENFDNKDEQAKTVDEKEDKAVEHNAGAKKTTPKRKRKT